MELSSPIKYSIYNALLVKLTKFTVHLSIVDSIVRLMLKLGALSIVKTIVDSENTPASLKIVGCKVTVYVSSSKIKNE